MSTQARFPHSLDVGQVQVVWDALPAVTESFISYGAQALLPEASGDDLDLSACPTIVYQPGATPVKTAVLDLYVALEQ